MEKTICPLCREKSTFAVMQPIRKSKKTKCVRISEETHKETIEILGDKIKIGAYADEALREKNKKEKAKK